MRTCFHTKSDMILFFTGLFLFASELWKQYTLTFVLGQGHYNWWYFPFQLCSIPMYLCLAVPFLSEEGKHTVKVFLMDYTLLSGIFTFFDTSGLLYPLPPLTIHSYLWHIVLILLGLFAGLTADFSFTWKHWRHATCIFALGCGIAEILNLSLHTFTQINMFYINPYYPVTQAVFRDIAHLFGRPVSLIFYVLSIVLGSALFHLAFLGIQKWNLRIYKSNLLC